MLWKFRNGLLLLLCAASCKTVSNRNVRHAHNQADNKNDVPPRQVELDPKPSATPRLPYFEFIPNVLTNKPAVIEAKGVNVESYRWSQKYGPAKLTFTPNNQSVSEVNAPSDGEYGIEIEGTGSDGAVVRTELSLTWDSQGPAIQVSEAIQTFMPTSIDARVSEDAVDLSWTKVSGSGTVTIESPKQAKTMVSASTDDVYVLRLTATDKAGNTTKTDVRLTWNTREPMVSLGNDLLSNQAIQVTAMHKDVTSFAWSQVSGPGVIAFSERSLPSTSISADVDGVYVIRLTATTAAGRETLDELKLTWDRTPPFLGDIVLTELAYGDFRLESSLSRYEDLTYQWSIKEGLGRALFTNPKSSATNVKVPDAGNLTLQLQAKDLAGNVATKTVVIPSFNQPNPATDIAVGLLSNCALVANFVKCWGYDNFGLGYPIRKDRLRPTTELVDLGPGRMAKAISNGRASSCVLLNGGQVLCWGADMRNFNNRLATPPETPVDLGPSGIATHISVGRLSACAIMNDGTVRCWGNNQDLSSLTGDWLQTYNRPITFEAGRRAIDLAVGSFHACVLLDNGKVRCWGKGYAYALGYGDNKDVPSPTSRSNPDIALELPARAVAAGHNTSCAILENMELRCWGDNSNRIFNPNSTQYADLKYPTRPAALPEGTKVKSVVISQASVCVITVEGAVLCMGSGYDENVPAAYYLRPALVDIGPGRKALKLDANPEAGQVCALLDDQTVKCWGNGVLGYGSSYDINTMPNRPLPL